MLKFPHEYGDTLSLTEFKKDVAIERSAFDSSQFDFCSVKSTFWQKAVKLTGSSSFSCTQALMWWDRWIASASRWPPVSGVGGLSPVLTKRIKPRVAVLNIEVFVCHTRFEAESLCELRSIFSSKCYLACLEVAQCVVNLRLSVI